MNTCGAFFSTRKLTSHAGRHTVVKSSFQWNLEYCVSRPSCQSHVEYISFYRMASRSYQTP